MRTLHRPIPLIALAGLAVGGCNDDTPTLPFDVVSTDAGGDTATGADSGADSTVQPDAASPDTESDGTTTDDVTTPETGADADATEEITDETRRAIEASIVSFCEGAVECASRGEYVPDYLSSLEGCVEDANEGLEVEGITEACALAYAGFAACAVDNADCVADRTEDGETYYTLEVNEYGCLDSYAEIQRDCEFSDYD